MMNEQEYTTRITRKLVKNGSDKLVIQAMSLITKPDEEIMSWNSRLHFDFENQTDVNQVNHIVFGDEDVTGLIAWFQSLGDLEYRLRKYSLSLVVGCIVDNEAMVSFVPMTSEQSFHARESSHFATAVYDCFYNDHSVIPNFCNKRERCIINALQFNDQHQALPEEIFVLGASFSVNEISQDESDSSESSTSSDDSTGSIDFSDQEERIQELVEYLRSDSSGYDSSV